MSKLRALAAALLVLALAGPVSDAMAQECFSGRSGRGFVERREAVPFPDAARRAGVARNNRVLGGVQLCRGAGGFTYRGRMLDQRGRVRQFDIPAR